MWVWRACERDATADVTKNVCERVGLGALLCRKNGQRRVRGSSLPANKNFPSDIAAAPYLVCRPRFFLACLLTCILTPGARG